MTAAPFLARQERFARVGSTNDIVREWLESGTPEVCLAVADEQTAGRGRDGRSWTAPSGAALLLSVGFRPTWLEPDRSWRLAACVALAMADAAEEVAGLRARSIRLKWPNDLIVESEDGAVRKLAGLLGETIGLGTAEPRTIVGVGLNAEWKAVDFPVAIASSMTSLREVAAGPIDRDALLAGFLERLEERIVALRAGRFDVAGWVARQLTSGRPVRLELPGGGTRIARALGVDPASGGLVVEDPDAPGRQRTVLTGEIVHLRLADAPIDAEPAGV